MAPTSRPKRKTRVYSDELKNEVLDYYEQHGTAAASKQFDVPKSTINSWARKDGRRTVRTERTRAMIEARTVDLKARRQELKALLLDDAHRLREQLWKPARLVNFGGKDNTLNETKLDEPLFVDKKNIMSSVGIAVDRIVKLEEIDNDDGNTEVISLLDQLAEQIGGDLDAE